ncbi:MAG: Ni/Fe hydrogenase subunit alpha [Nitrosomonas sp.]|nr:Ni/Fe hydrogenase subunit alpha [Nitrosomonas sp.]
MKKESKKTKTIKVDYLARVEGEGAFHIKIENNQVSEAHLNIFEPPRFFEGFLKGRSFREAPDITARICGICPVAYQMSSVHAIELAYGVNVPEHIRLLRRLLYCGEWVESHVLHIYMLHAPDFLGFPDAITMAKKHRSVVERGLRLKKAGNSIVNLLGGREIHPINVKVGGFYRLPTKDQWSALTDELKWARDAAAETVRWVKDLPFPDYTFDYQFVSLKHEYDYPMNEGLIGSSSGLAIPASDYENEFQEVHEKRSTALHSIRKDGSSYLTGPLARYALNYDQLSAEARKLAEEAGLGKICLNPFKSIIVRAVETFYALDEALRIIALNPEGAAAVDVEPGVACRGFAATEAPRGILYHRYSLNEQGLIEAAKIVAPTSQNQRMIEDDLKAMVSGILDYDDDRMRHRCEQSIRNYDPCISCSAHFLKLKVERQ